MSIKVALTNVKDEVKINVTIIYIYISIVTLSGCGQLWAIDGNWKLHYPICMYDVPKTTDCFSNNLNYVRTCPNAPEHGRAFCYEHMEQ